MPFRKGEAGNPTGKGGFKKGQSGNPGGRSRQATDLAHWCREKSAEALERVYQLMQSNDEKVSLAAAQVLLDRGLGKPVQHQIQEVATRNVVRAPTMAANTEEFMRIVKASGYAPAEETPPIPAPGSDMKN